MTDKYNISMDHAINKALLDTMGENRPQTLKEENAWLTANIMGEGKAEILKIYAELQADVRAEETRKEKVKQNHAEFQKWLSDIPKCVELEYTKDFADGVVEILVKVNQERNEKENF